MKTVMTIKDISSRESIVRYPFVEGKHPIPAEGTYWYEELIEKGTMSDKEGSTKKTYYDGSK